MPTGKVKWYDEERGFGFIASEDGSEIFLHASALPADVTSVKPGARVEFGVADGRRGPSALSVKVLDPAPTTAKAKRKAPSELGGIVEDLITVLDRVGDQLKRGKYPDSASGKRVATLLRAVADDLDS